MLSSLCYFRLQNLDNFAKHQEDHQECSLFPCRSRSEVVRSPMVSEKEKHQLERRDGFAVPEKGCKQVDFLQGLIYTRMGIK